MIIIVITIIITHFTGVVIGRWPFPSNYLGWCVASLGKVDLAELIPLQVRPEPTVIKLEGLLFLLTPCRWFHCGNPRGWIHSRKPSAVEAVFTPQAQSTLFCMMDVDPTMSLFKNPSGRITNCSPEKPGGGTGLVVEKTTMDRVFSIKGSK